MANIYYISTRPEYYGSEATEVDGEVCADIIREKIEALFPHVDFRIGDARDEFEDELLRDEIIQTINDRWTDWLFTHSKELAANDRDGVYHCENAAARQNGADVLRGQDFIDALSTATSTIYGKVTAYEAAIIDREYGIAEVSAEDELGHERVGRGSGTLQ